RLVVDVHAGRPHLPLAPGLQGVRIQPVRQADLVEGVQAAILERHGHACLRSYLVAYIAHHAPRSPGGPCRHDKAAGALFGLVLAGPDETIAVPDAALGKIESLYHAVAVQQVALAHPAQLEAAR